MPGKLSGGGTVDHLDKEMESRLIKDLKAGEEDDIDQDDLDDDEEDAIVEDDEIKKQDKKRDTKKKIDAGDEKERQRQQQKEEEEDEQEADDDAPTDEKQEEDRLTKEWSGRLKVNKGAGRKDKAVKVSKDDDHSDEVLDEYSRYHMTSAFRHGGCDVDGSDEAWDEDAHKKEFDWVGNEQGGHDGSGNGYDGVDNLIDDDGGDLFE